MEILFARHAGFCFGVERAVELARAASGAPIRTLGPLIHNPAVLAELAERGITPVGGVAELTDGTVVIRAHGVSDKIRSELAERGLKVVDASCPFVHRLHAATKKVRQSGRAAVIVGRRDHPEMLAVVEDFPEVVVVDSPAAPELKLLAGQAVGLLAQTTERAEKLTAVASGLRALGCAVEVVNTICSATTDRQTAAVELARQVEVMLVFGGRESNNTKKLYELCCEITRSYWLEDERELKPEWFTGVQKVGLTAGASTPDSTLKKAAEWLRSVER